MHVCLFDIDGTLLSSGGAGKAAMEDALLREFRLAQVHDGVPYSGRTDRAIARDLFTLHDVEASPENWQRFLAAYLGHLPDYLQRHRGRIMPGIEALLAQLHQRGDVAVGLLTGNVRDGARLKLSHYGLYQYFAFGGFGDHHFERNDVARDALAAVTSHLGSPIRPDQVWVIGDTPLDVACARAIGARVVAVGTGWHSMEELAASAPDLLFNDLSDAAPLLARWV